MLLGMCPALAVTNSATNGFAMAAATTFVLLSSSTFVSLIRRLVPSQVRIPTYIIIIAGFVTLADLFLKAQFPAISKSLGPYIPLIVVNCLILGRSEFFASKHTPFRAIIDGLGMGAGFMIVLVVLGSVREIFGSGSIFGFVLMTEDVFTPWVVMVLPAGAFLSLGLLMGLLNIVTRPKRGGSVMKIFLVFISAAIVNNLVLAYFLGICPFLGVSKKIDTSVNMGLATTFVMTLTAVITWVINTFILVKFNLPFLMYVTFIITIASLVQLVEMFIKKTSPPLYRSLGIFLPLITTNCAILGLALFAILKEYTLLESLSYGIGGGVGFTLALVIMAGIREELEFADVPESLKGAPMTLLVAGMLALAFMGFAGLLSV